MVIEDQPTLALFIEASVVSNNYLSKNVRSSGKPRMADWRRLSLGWRSCGSDAMTSEATKQPRQAYSLSTGWLAYACLSGNGCFAVAVLALHLLQPERSTLSEAVSFYVHGAQGWLFTAGMLAWGVGSAALVLGLARTIRIRAGAAGLFGLAVWSAGVLTSGFFRADPPGQWGNSPSAAALIHENAARVSFIALPIAALLLSHGLRRAPEWRRTADVLYLLAVAII